MPNHHPIEGGRPTGKPRDWNEAEQGPCGTLSVLYARDDRGMATMTSAWRLTPAEIQAMQREGVLFLQILGQQHPVISLWVQTATGELVPLEAEPEPAASSRDGLVDGIGQREPVADAGLVLDAALAAATDELYRQADGPATVGEIDDAGRVFVQGTIDLKAILETALERAAPAIPAEHIVQVPVLTLDAISAEGQTRKALGITPCYQHDSFHSDCADCRSMNDG